MGLLSKIGQALLEPFTSIGQSIIESRTQKYNVDKTIQANKQLAEYQYSKDLEMWNKANEYNSPAAQMARYTSAGLNPNLIYGTGTASAGNTATTLPKYQAPTVQYDYKPPVDIAKRIGEFQNFQLRQAQIDNLKEQNRIYRLTGDEKFYDVAGWYPTDSEGIIAPKSVLRSSQAIIRKAEADQIAKMWAEKLQNIRLSNDMKELQRDWFKFNTIGNMATKALGAIGISKIGGILAGRPKFRGYGK